MKVWVGFDVGKAAHWVSVLDDEGNQLFSRKVGATEEDVEAALREAGRFGEERAFGVDIVGGPATLLAAALLARGERVFYLSGRAVNRARDAYAGGERKSDPRDARLIADQLRMRWRSLAEVRPRDEASSEMRALVAHRRDLVQDQTRRVTRLRALLVEVFPGLEAALDFDRKSALLAVTRVATPAAARRLGEARLARWLEARGVRKAAQLARRVLEAAKGQRRELPAAGTKAALAAEIASEVLRARERLAELEERLGELVEASPQGQLVGTLPGMGTVLTAQFLAEAGGDPLSRFGSADRLAGAAGVAPALRASGGLSYQRRARRGNKALKHVFYRSAFCALSRHEPSQEYYRRKRAEGKRHHQAVMALARRRVNVLWAMLRDGQPYREQAPAAA